MSMILRLADASSVIGNSATAACGTSCNTTSLGSIFASIGNVLTFLIGAVSVVMIIIGGMRYIMSQGDPKAVGEAKNTLLYAVIGVIVAIAAFAIVNFVIRSVR